MAMAALALRWDFDNVFFSLDLATKDVSLALDSAMTWAWRCLSRAAALDVYEDAEDAGLGSKVFFATLRALEASAGIEVPLGTFSPALARAPPSKIRHSSL